jgi:hypothetical protein
MLALEELAGCVVSEAAANELWPDLEAGVR